MNGAIQAPADTAGAFCLRCEQFFMDMYQYLRVLNEKIARIGIVFACLRRVKCMMALQRRFRT
jgi:hypothetical protein